MKRRVPFDAFDRLSSWEALWAAWHRARRGKRRSGPAATFEVDAERHLVGLHRALQRGYYRPRPYRIRIIQDPKVRAIVLADFSDRVVHQALHHEMAPWFERSLIDHTYACLPGRGTHRAVLRYLTSTRRYRYRLSLDLQRYFLSIDHNILLALFFERIVDPRLRQVLERIVRSGSGLYRRTPIVRALPKLAEAPVPNDVGLPIGTLVSQFSANIYLSGVDHFVVRTLKIGRYQRYMDDLTLFSNDRLQLEEARAAIAAWVEQHRKLCLHPAEVQSTGSPSVYLGYRVSRAGLRIGPKAKRRLRANLKRAVVQGPEAVRATLMAYRGIALFG